eukprot:gene8459-4902_t
MHEPSYKLCKDLTLEPTHALSLQKPLKAYCFSSLGVTSLRPSIGFLYSEDGLSEVEKWLLLHEADLTIIKPALLGALGNARDDDWLWIFEDVEAGEPREDVVRWAELGDSLNMPEVKAICFKWLEENLQNHLSAGVKNEERATTITRWLKLVEQPTFASLKPICTSWLASNIKTCLTENNAYSWVKRAEENQWDGVLAAALTWLAESSNCEGLAQLLDSTPLTSLLESLETPCVIKKHRECLTRVLAKNGELEKRIRDIETKEAKEERAIEKDVRLEAAAQLHAVREACKACGVPAEKLDACIAKRGNAGVLKKQAAPQAVPQAAPQAAVHSPGPSRSSQPPTGPPRPSQPPTAYPCQPGPPTGPPRPSQPPTAYPYQPGPPTGPPRSSQPQCAYPFQPVNPTGPPRSSHPPSLYPYQPVYPTEPPRPSQPPSAYPYQPVYPTEPPKSSQPPSAYPYQPVYPTEPPRPSQPPSAYPYQPVYPTESPKSSQPPSGNPYQPGPPTGPPRPSQPPTAYPYQQPVPPTLGGVVHPLAGPYAGSPPPHT